MGRRTQSQDCENSTLVQLATTKATESLQGNAGG